MACMVWGYSIKVGKVVLKHTYMIWWELDSTVQLNPFPQQHLKYTLSKPNLDSKGPKYSNLNGALYGNPLVQKDGIY